MLKLIFERPHQPYDLTFIVIIRFTSPLPPKKSRRKEEEEEIMLYCPKM
jgi:hypothetical protein